MRITRLNEARRYDAPGHFDMRAMRLQGFDASPSAFAWVGLSHFLPGGGADLATSPLEKIYVVTAGTITIELGDGTVERLETGDSCLIPADEYRAVRNDTNLTASMLVIMPYPSQAATI